MSASESGPSWPPGTGLIEVESIASTSDEARARAVAGEPGPLWIRADRQTAGRGRRGRAWTSEPGNLFATLLLRPACAPGTAAQLSYVAALAVADAARDVLGAPMARLKWPNDVRIDGAKIAGILLESGGQTGSGELGWITVGIGINLASSPANAGYPVTSLGAVKGGPPPAPRAVMGRLADAMARWLEIWAHGEGFPAIREAWLAQADGLGHALEARTPTGALRGLFEGLDGDGALLLRLDDGTCRRIHGGEVFFPASQPHAAQGEAEDRPQDRPQDRR